LNSPELEELATRISKDQAAILANSCQIREKLLILKFWEVASEHRNLYCFGELPILTDSVHLCKPHTYYMTINHVLTCR